MGIYEAGGVDPVAAYIPSLDVAGLGTATVTDLTGGGDDGTLINLVPASDWLLDDGKYAIRTDGVDGYLSIPTNFGSAETHVTLSAWFRKTGSTRALITNGVSGFWIYETIAYTQHGPRYTQQSWNLTGWHHWMVAYDGTQATNATRWKLYIDGVLQSPLYLGGTWPATWDLSFEWRVGRTNGSAYYQAWYDDLRFFNVTLDASAAAYLATSRGVTAGGPSAKKRRRKSGIPA